MLGSKSYASRQILCQLLSIQMFKKKERKKKEKKRENTLSQGWYLDYGLIKNKACCILNAKIGIT